MHNNYLEKLCNSFFSVHRGSSGEFLNLFADNRGKPSLVDLVFDDLQEFKGYNLRAFLTSNVIRPFRLNTR